MHKRESSEKGFGIAGVIAITLVVIVLVLIGHAVLAKKNTTKTPSSSNTTTTPDASSSTSSGNFTTLPPATLPSKVAECTQSLTYDANGVPQPAQCLNGDLNVTEWDALSALEPKVMALGYNPSAAQVSSAICADVNVADEDESAAVSNAVEESVYQISAIYYNWSFPTTNPAAVLTNGTC